MLRRSAGVRARRRNPERSRGTQRSLLSRRAISCAHAPDVNPPEQFAAAAPAPSPPTARQPILTGVLKGTAIYAAATFFIKALNFFLLPLYTRYLAPRDYGVVSLAEIIALLVATIFGLGLDAALPRLYFEHADDSRQQRLCVSSILRLGLLLAVAAALASFVAGDALQHWFAVKWQLPFFPYIALAGGAAVAMQAAQFRLALFQVEMRPGAFAALTALGFILTAGAVIALVILFPHGAAGMLLGKLLAAGISAAIALVLLRSWLSSGWQWNMAREALGLSVPLMPHQLTALGLVVADRFFIARYRTLDEVGVYSLAYTCGMAMFLITSSLMRAWSPAFYQQAQSEDMKAELGSLISLLAGALSLVAVAGICISPLAARLLDNRYQAAMRVIPLVVLAYLLHAMFALFQLPIMQSKRSGFIFGASAVALASNLALNLLWIPRWGVYGAAWASVAAYAVEAGATYFAAQAVWPLAYRRGQIAAGLLLAALLAAATQFTHGMLESMLLAAFGSAVGALAIWTMSLRQTFRSWS